MAKKPFLLLPGDGLNRAEMELEIEATALFGVRGH